jgi:hypothetical protein
MIYIPMDTLHRIIEKSYRDMVSLWYKTNNGGSPKKPNDVKSLFENAGYADAPGSYMETLMINEVETSVYKHAADSRTYYWVIKNKLGIIGFSSLYGSGDELEDRVEIRLKCIPHVGDVDLYLHIFNLM